MPKYTVLSAVEHDGKRYEANGEIDLKEEQAKPLLEGGAIKLADTASRVPGPKNPPRHPTDKEFG